MNSLFPLSLYLAPSLPKRFVINFTLLCKDDTPCKLIRWNFPRSIDTLKTDIGDGLYCTDFVLDMIVQMPLIDCVHSLVFLTSSIDTRTHCLDVCLTVYLLVLFSCCPSWMLFKGGDRKGKICPMLSCDVQYRTCRIRPVHCYSLLRTLGCPIVSMLSHWVKARHL